MAKQRDVTALESLTSFGDGGYVIAVQDSELYALPKSVLAKEVHTQGVGEYSELALDNPISVANDTATTIQSITFTTAGTYLIDADINFEENGSGARICKISPTTNDTEMTRSTVTTVPVTGIGTCVTLQTIVNATAGKVYYINVRQTSGMALNVNSKCRIVKLANPNT